LRARLSDVAQLGRSASPVHVPPCVAGPAPRGDDEWPAQWRAAARRTVRQGCPERVPATQTRVRGSHKPWCAAATNKGLVHARPATLRLQHTACTVHQLPSLLLRLDAPLTRTSPARLGPFPLMAFWACPAVPGEADEAPPQRTPGVTQAPGRERRDAPAGGGQEAGEQLRGGGAKEGAAAEGGDEDALLSAGHGGDQRRAAGGGVIALDAPPQLLPGDKLSVRTLEAATEAYLTRCVLLLCLGWHVTAWALTAGLNYLQAAEPLDKLYSVDDAALAPEHVQFGACSAVPLAEFARQQPRPS
jgi:hypothetical protein